MVNVIRKITLCAIIMQPLYTTNIVRPEETSVQEEPSNAGMIYNINIYVILQSICDVDYIIRCYNHITEQF